MGGGSNISRLAIGCSFFFLRFIAVRAAFRHDLEKNKKCKCDSLFSCSAFLAAGYALFEENKVAVAKR